MVPQRIGIIWHPKSEMTTLPTVARVPVKSNRNVNFLYFKKKFNSLLILTKFLTNNEQNAYYQ